MTIPRNSEQENSFSIRRIVTSKSDCLASGSQHQIVFLERGAIVHREGDQRIRDRSLLFIPPGRGEALRLAAMSRIWQILFGAAFWDGPSHLNSWKIQSWRLSEQLVSRVQIILAQILEEYEEKSAGYERMIRLKLEELALLLERSLPRIRYPGSDKGAFSIDEIVEYIQLHYSNDFSLSSLSSLCGLTPSYFSRVFKEKTGTPVFEYVNRIRVQKARALLKKTEMSIIEIAFAVGYNNVSFFNRYFRKLNRMSPREYRKYIRR